MMISVVPPPISINVTPNCFSFLSNTDVADASGSKIKPSNSIPTRSKQVFKSVSIFLAIVTVTFASSLCPDKPSGLIIFGLSSTLNSLIMYEEFFFEVADSLPLLTPKLF